MAALISLLFAVPENILAQRVTNVYPEIEGEKILVYYDLTGISPTQSVIITLFMSTDGGKTYGSPLRSVSGDIGLVTGPGKKSIIWDVFKDRDELLSTEVKFRVRAELTGYEQVYMTLGRKFKLNLSPNMGVRNIIDYKSYGINIKGAVYLNRLGLGLRADLYRTFREEIDYSYSGNIYPDTGYYWGYSGGAIIEYDLLKNEKYGLYPFIYIGSAKVIYQYNKDYRQESYFKYSIFGSLGFGFDINVYKFLYLGTEIEYFVSPWIDVVPSEDPDEGLDGFNIGFVIKFVIDSG